MIQLLQASGLATGSGEPLSSVDAVNQLFDHFSGYRGWDRPLSDLVALFHLASAELAKRRLIAHERKKKELAELRRQPLWIRIWVWLAGETPVVPPLLTKEEALEAYCGTLWAFEEWLSLGQSSSGQFCRCQSLLPICRELREKLMP